MHKCISGCKLSFVQNPDSNALFFTLRYVVKVIQVPSVSHPKSRQPRPSYPPLENRKCPVPGCDSQVCDAHCETRFYDGNVEDGDQWWWFAGLKNCNADCVIDDDDDLQGWKNAKITMLMVWLMMTITGPPLWQVGETLHPRRLPHLP